MPSFPCSLCFFMVMSSFFEHMYARCAATAVVLFVSISPPHVRAAMCTRVVPSHGALVTHSMLHCSNPYTTDVGGYGHGKEAFAALSAVQVWEVDAMMKERVGLMDNKKPHGIKKPLLQGLKKLRLLGPHSYVGVAPGVPPSTVRDISPKQLRRMMRCARQFLEGMRLSTRYLGRPPVDTHVRKTIVKAPHASPHEVVRADHTFSVADLLRNLLYPATSTSKSWLTTPKKKRLQPLRYVEVIQAGWSSRDLIVLHRCIISHCHTPLFRQWWLRDPLLRQGIAYALPAYDRVLRQLPVGASTLFLQRKLILTEEKRSTKKNNTIAKV